MTSVRLDWGKPWTASG